jgi:hypothetical protein
MTLSRLLFVAVALVASLCAPTNRAFAQSSDQNLPTAVLGNDISGRITALDLGDPRQTRHFYAFEGNAGDLLITVESQNLNGDVDVFTAVTFRPLMKSTMIATSQSSEITKGIYLRAHQILILRVEARTPNDEPGTYRIHFGGTFAPFSGGIPVAGNSPAETTAEKSEANRLSSVGATIPRPVEEVAAEPKPSPEKTEEKPAETAKPTTEKRTTTSRRTTPRNPRRTTRPAPAKPGTTKKTDSTGTEAAKTDAKKEDEKPAAVSEKPAETTAPSSEKPKTQEVAPPGAHLIIEEKDGTRIDRPMSTIRRVVIEGPAIVIVLKTGKIERVPMADVLRMSIEPQQ